MPASGLCDCIPQEYKETLKMFDPEDYLTYGNYWGADKPWNEYLIKGDVFDDRNRFGGYGILRQTIVLMICAMHNEL